MVVRFINWIKSLFAPSLEGAKAPLTKTPVNVSRSIDKIIIHCTASDVDKHGRNMQYYLYKWHVEERGFSDIGYHFGIDLDGQLLAFRPIGKIGAHCFGHNAGSIGIAVHGKDKFYQWQFDELKSLVNKLCKEYGLTLDDVYPHSAFSDKACPNFDIKEVL